MRWAGSGRLSAMLNLLTTKPKKADTAAEEGKDAFLEALVFITGYFGHTRSAPALQAGLPVGKDGMTPKLFCQAADRAGFKARIVKRKLEKIPAEVIPAVIITKDKKALILLQQGDKAQYRVLDPASKEEKTLDVKE